MQTTVEMTEAHPTSCKDGNKLASPTGQGTSHLPVPQPSPENGGSAFKAEGRSPSGKGFLKKKFPLWLKRKGPANSPQGLAVSRSRLCMEATHESPIQAVRKPTQREALGLATEEDSTREKTGPSLLRKLWCLKATDSRLKKPPLGSEASPLQRARCGPVAALSRAADPHGESPLRWKPRGETRSPEEVGSLAEPEKVGTVRRPGASWLAKPWRTFRAVMTARARKASVLSGNHRHPGATGERVLCLPTELETSPATKPIGEQPHVGAVDKTPPPTPPPSVMDELCGSREDEEANRTPQHRLESHRRMEAVPKPVPKLPTHEKNGCRKDNPILEAVFELEGIPTEVGHLPGGRLEAGGAATEDEGSGQGDDGYWLERSAGEDLAELAENPGGQGMVMATRGWLTSEGLGGPKAAASTTSHPNKQGIEQETVVLAGRPQGSEDSEEQASGVSLDKTSGVGCRFPPALSENGINGTVTSHRSGIATLEEVDASYPTSSWEMILPAPLEPCPSFSSREFKTGAEGNLASVPVQTAVLDLLGENSSSPGSPSGQPLPSPTESHGAVPGPEEKQKRLIYVAAVEIVEAAIDAAAEKLAKKREQESAGLQGQADVTANSLAGDAMQQCGWLA